MTQLAPRTKADYPYVPKVRVDDPALLLPSFQPVVGKVFWRLVELGFVPVVFDTLRTPAEALKNVQKGTGSKNSLHLHGAACDLVCSDHLWSCREHKCKFYDHLRELWLEHAYIGPLGDYPHGQALPVSQQANFRALPPAQRDAFVKVWLAKKR